MLFLLLVEQRGLPKGRGRGCWQIARARVHLRQVFEPFSQMHLNFCPLHRSQAGLFESLVVTVAVLVVELVLLLLALLAFLPGSDLPGNCSEKFIFEG